MKEKIFIILTFIPELVCAIAIASYRATKETIEDAKIYFYHKHS